MTMPQLLRDAGHIHISEREAAHEWPDGRWDDRRWEDCLWDSGLEWYRITQDDSPPAKHAEGEALRAESGEPPTGGSNMNNLLIGFKRRYGVSVLNGVSVYVSNYSSLIHFLKPGCAAVVTGSLSAFPYTHRLSKWDPSYDGPHAMLVANIGGILYLCDPLAPADAAVPVIITAAELQQFVNALPGAVHLVAPITRKVLMPRYNPGGPVIGQVTVTKTGHAVYTPDDGVYHQITTVPYVRNVLGDGVPDPTDPSLPPALKLSDGSGRPFWLVEVAGKSGWLPKDSASTLVPSLFTEEQVASEVAQAERPLVARIAGLEVTNTQLRTDIVNAANAERERLALAVAAREAEKVRNS